MVVNSPVATNNTKEKKISIANIVAGITGFLIGTSANTAARCLAGGITAPKMLAINGSLTADQFDKVQVAVGEALKNSKLKDKGVDIIKVGRENVDDAIKLLINEQNTGIKKFLPAKLKETIAAAPANQLLQGSNAFYASKANKILIPQNNKIALASFHEIGHAFNANASKFGKVLQKARGTSALVMPILLISMFKNKKKDGEQPKNGLDKATDFVKNNAGKLTFAAMTPILLEEGLATIKGNKLAKNLLSPDLFKKVSKSNILGFASYALAAVGTSLSIVLANKLRDKTVEKKESRKKDKMFNLKGR